MDQTTNSSAPDQGPVLKTLLVSDLVASTRLVENLGDAASAALFERHDRLVRDLLREHDGREIDKTDGFLLLFERPIHAVLFACAYHDALTRLPPLQARLGIHLGEVLVRRNRPADVARGAKPIEVEGLAKPMTARLMALASGRQTLMTRAAFDLARRSAVDETSQAEKLSWLAHGRYLFKGVKEPVEVFEVGEEGLSVLEPPAGSDKVSPVLGENVVLGWRPAPGLTMPGRSHWTIDKKLGAGGFGEVWLAEHKKTHEQRVLKFCYETSRLENLRREITLFLLLKEELGERDDIGRIFDWNFDAAPFYIESEYTVGGNLAEWVEARGGLSSIPVEERLELVIQVAEALAAAHSIGVLHKDVKPTNILIWRDTDGRSRTRLTDFGIGAVIEQQGLSETGMIALETTRKVATEDGGTPIYMAPELIEGRAATVQADVYALGVMLYQMVVGDLSRALAPGWRREIDDELLCSDVAAAVDGDPQHRLASCAELARRLRALDERRAKREAESDLQEALGRSRQRRRQISVAAAVLAVFAVTVSVLALQIRREAQNAKEQARRARELAYTSVAGNLLFANRATLGNLVALEVGEPELHQSLKKRVVLRILADHDDSVLAAEFSPDGSRVVTSSSDKTLKVWDAESGEVVARLIGHTARVYDAAFSPDGSRVASAADDRTARIWDAETGEQLLSFDGHAEGVFGVSFSADGTRVASGSHDRTVRVWNAETGDEIIRLEGHTARVRDVAFSPDDSRLLTGSDDQTTRIWNPVSGQEILRIEDHGDAVLAVAFSPDGERVLTGANDGTTRVWNARTGDVVARLEGHVSSVWCVAFSTDGTLAITGSSDQTARIWNPVNGKEIARLGDHTGPIYHVAFSHDDSRIVTGSGDDTARIWNLRNDEEIRRFDSHDGRIFTASFSPDGGRVITASSDRTAGIWRTGDGSQITRLRGHSDIVTAAFFSPDGERAVTASRDKTVRVWNARSGEEQMRMTGHVDWVLSAAFSPDGTRVASSSSDQTSRIWNAETGEEIAVLSGHTGEVGSAAFSPDGRRVLTSSYDTTMNIWDVETGVVITRLAGDTGRVYFASFNSDGTRVLTGSRDRAARIWNAETGEEIARFEGHAGPVYAVAWSPDDDRIATGSRDMTARLWNAQTGELLASMEGHTDLIGFVAFSPDGSRLLTGSVDNTARLWLVTDDYETYLRSRIRARTPLCLSADFRQSSLAEAPVVADRISAACEACVPIFFERLGDARISDLEPHLEAWRAYERCLGREQLP